MATLSNGTVRYLDASAVTAGESWTINTKATLNIRTDTRVHGNAPASMTGSLGSITINQGEVTIDASNIRWIPFTGGTSVVPTIGHTITQGSVTGYFLGVWADLTSAPSAVGSAMPATGFIKFREVTSGPFIAGNLTNQNTSTVICTVSGNDVPGWIEVVLDQASNITVTRLGKFITRGDYFYLDNTTGVRGQVLQTPTNGGGANTLCAGVEIETAPGSNEYEFWPALFSTNNGWVKGSISTAKDSSDKRIQFVSALSNGQMQIGDSLTNTGTYTYTASQSSTYALWNVSGCSVTIVNNVAYIYNNLTQHGIVDGTPVGIAVSSGVGVSGIYTATVVDANTISVPMTGNDESGVYSLYIGMTVTFTAHGLNIGDKVRLTPTTGGLPAGIYEVYSVPSANTYRILYATTTPTSTGNTGALHTITCTNSVTHALAVGSLVNLEFTSGTAVNGTYVVRTVPSTTTFTINCPLSATTSGGYNSYYDYGHVPVVGCKTRIPNIITRECSTGSRATNNVPNATLATRPEFLTTSAGYIDIEYLYNCNWYTRFNQPYYVKYKNSWTTDTLEIAECASAFEISNVGVGMLGGQDIRALQLNSNFTGGTITNCTFQRGNVPSTTDHAVEVAYCKNITMTNVIASIVQFVRSTGYPFQFSFCDNLTLTSLKSLNGPIQLTTCSNSTITNTDYCDRLVGKSNGTTPYYAIYIANGSNNVVVNGFTSGLNNTIDDCHPVQGIVSTAASTNIKVRNLGTASSLVKTGKWFKNAYGMGTLVSLAGNGNNIKVQRCYSDIVRTGLVLTNNADKNVIIENVHCNSPYQIATMAVATPVFAALNGTVKGYGSTNETTGNASVYGSHFRSLFTNSMGYLVLSMNEPTPETAQFFTEASGPLYWDSSGGLLMGTIGNQAIWESPDWILGHTGFASRVNIMNGGTLSHYLIEYKMDTGSGYGDVWKTLNVTNLQAETVNPSTGFKIKIRITTSTTNTTAITFLRIPTTTTWDAQTANMYPLDTVTLLLTGLKTDSEVRCYVGTDPATAVEIGGIETSGTTFSFQHANAEATGFIRILHDDYAPISLDYVYPSIDTELLIQQTIDRTYI